MYKQIALYSLTGGISACIIAKFNDTLHNHQYTRKDYTKKFCNSIGFGLSKESAMKFSFSENKEVFKTRKGIDKINKELLAQEIANSVIDNCGYQLNLYSDVMLQLFLFLTNKVNEKI